MEKFSPGPRKIGSPLEGVLQEFATQYSRQNPNQPVTTVRKQFRRTNTANQQESDPLSVAGKDRHGCAGEII